MVDPNDDPIELVPSRYTAWRRAYEAERDRIRDVLDDRGCLGVLDRIAHVGSTAVPDLAAKDIVDVDVVVADDAVETVSRALVDDLGGSRVENSDEWHPVFRVEDGQRFNDHVFALSSPRWRISVATREGLRRYEDVRREYENVKRSLAGETDDLAEYSRGKSDVVARILARVRGDEDCDLGFAVPDP